MAGVLAGEERAELGVRDEVGRHLGLGGVKRVKWSEPGKGVGASLSTNRQSTQPAKGSHSALPPGEKIRRPRPCWSARRSRPASGETILRGWLMGGVFKHQAGSEAFSGSTQKYTYDTNNKKLRFRNIPETR